ncbi:MAG: 4'-phosphopantetheinyl transferase superfamily protein [Defluviitaleaceae bacterium]|nr:4'-phosphopantetheinyl transferase superfamily protein [Defluviitaleaceae bacterium]
MIYVFEQLDSVTDKFASEFLANMPIERQSKALKYRRKLDRNLCIMGYWLLCRGLQKEYDICEYPRFIYNEYGKPSLADYPNIHFNISHCNRAVTCVISKKEVGLDIQNIRPYKPEVAKRVCTDDEMKLLDSCPHPEMLFCRMWTIKESYLKLLGSGIQSLENKICTMSFSDKNMFTYWGEGYHLCCMGIS